jgi:hypothetical protein
VLDALQRALGGGAFDLGLVGVAPGDQLLLAGDDLLALDFRGQLLVGRLLALQLRRSGPASEFGQHLALLHRVAGVDLEHHGGRRGAYSVGLTAATMRP